MTETPKVDVLPIHRVDSKDAPPMGGLPDGRWMQIAMADFERTVTENERYREALERLMDPLMPQSVIEICRTALSPTTQEAEG